MKKITLNIRKVNGSYKEYEAHPALFALIDNEDYALVSKYKWHPKKHGNTFYAACNLYINKKHKSLSMHRLILGLTDSAIKVDHKNHNGLDNRKINIRKCTQAENMRNIIFTNKALYRGVVKQSQKYRASIVLNYKRIYLGVFTDIKDAARAYNVAALKYHGKFAVVNENV